MRVVLHADASPAIGTGHVVRSLSLAAALAEQGAQVTLASEELVDGMRERAARLGVPVVSRSSAPRDPDWVVVDGYHLDAATRAGLAHPDVPRLVIDDHGRDLAGATMVLNQNLYAGPANHGASPGTEVLAGPAYALLHPDFAGLEPERPQPPVAERVLVTMGGSDPHDATNLAIEALSGFEPPVQVRVVVGAGNQNRQSLAERASAAGFEVIHDAPSLAPHLAWSDLVVSGCGTSVLEAARCGRPIVGLILADNQRPVAASVEREGLGVVAGSHPGLEASDLRSALDAIRGDHPMRERIATSGPRLVDGRGARRAARAMATGPLRLRPATLVDSERLLEWRNDPDARRASFDQAVVDRATHAAWLDRRIDAPDHRIWIGELAGAAIGVARFALEGDTATISVALALAHRSGGIGTRLISIACSVLAAEVRVGAVEAWVRTENRASASAFWLAGFRPAGDREPDRQRYRLALRPMG